MHTNIRAYSDISHVLRGNEDELLLGRAPGTLNLHVRPSTGSPYHHPHRHLPIHSIHKNVTSIRTHRERGAVQFIKSTKWRPHGLPNGEQHANLSKRLFPARKGFGILPRALSTGIDLDFQLAIAMVDDELALVPTQTHEMREQFLCLGTDQVAENDESTFSLDEGVIQGLLPR
jgi:hypothetical protein